MTMPGYLIAEEGPLTGLVLRFEEGTEWILGRDPDVSSFVLEDPMVSRRHVICRLTPEGFLLENLSSVNPATQNGKVIAEPILLREGDIIQIGSTFFRFTEKNPVQERPHSEEEPLKDFEEELGGLAFDIGSEGRWLLKVISGPNAGAEFAMKKGATYILGKDPEVSDIVFQDLSVSRKHARLSVDEDENVFIEDLGSRNGVLINGELVLSKHLLSSQDLIALGTTSFLIIDRSQVSETIISPPSIAFPKFEQVPVEEPSEKEEPEAPALPREPGAWKEMIIPRRHLIMAGSFALVLLVIIFALFSLFSTEPIAVHAKNETVQIKEQLSAFPDVQFSYSAANGKLFLVGHVLTAVDKQELTYLLSTLPFIQSVEDNVVIDEFVWQNMNALLATNPDWQGISFHSTMPGKFVMRGYLQTLEQAQVLADYVNTHFPYLDKLENQVVVENNLTTQIQSMLTSKGFGNVAFQLSNVELVLSGRVEQKHSSGFDDLVQQFKGLMGIRVVKNFVIITTEDAFIDLSTHYNISGYSKRDDKNFFVVINGHILSKGDLLDGMTITAVQPNVILLEKDGLKYKINYNLQ